MKLIAMVAAVAALGLLALVAPNFIRGRNTAAQDACIRNLRQMDAAFDSATNSPK